MSASVKEHDDDDIDDDAIRTSIGRFAAGLRTLQTSNGRYGTTNI